MSFMFSPLGKSNWDPCSIYYFPLGRIRQSLLLLHQHPKKAWDGTSTVLVELSRGRLKLGEEAFKRLLSGITPLKLLIKY